MPDGFHVAIASIVVGCIAALWYLLYLSERRR